MKTVTTINELVTQDVIKQQITKYEKILQYNDDEAIRWGSSTLGKVSECPVCHAMGTQCMGHGNEVNCPAVTIKDTGDLIECFSQNWFDKIVRISTIDTSPRQSRAKRIKVFVTERLNYWKKIHKENYNENS